MVRRRLLVPLLLLAGCASYDPPMAGDHTTARYQTDLARCRKQASLAASQVANATPQTAIVAIFKSSDPERDRVRSCMQSRGYRLAS